MQHQASWAGRLALGLLLLSSPLSSATPAPQEKSVAAIGEGPVVVRLDRTLPPPRERVEGFVEAYRTSRSGQLYAGEQPSYGGLYRLQIQMDLPNLAGSLAENLQLVEDLGMQAWLTVVGTPFDLATQFEDEAEGTLDAYARSVPSDLQEWADRVVAVLQECEEESGLLPDYVEIWNEPERAEWWSGTQEEYEELYAVAAQALDQAFPERAFRIGGPALAGATSTFDGEEPFLLEFVDAAIAREAPLEFVSWHHYDLGGAIRYYDVYEQLQERLDAYGLQDVLRIVSEWNLAPSSFNNPEAGDLDRSHAAAMALNVIDAAIRGDLDGQIFFQLQDVDQQFGTSDFLLGAPGLMTLHGIYKPVYRLLEGLRQAAALPAVEVEYPLNEWGLGVSAFRADRFGVLFVGWDTVDAEWVWAEGCKERGAQPGVLWSAVEDAFEEYGTLSEQTLVAVGLEEWEAAVALEVYALALEAQVVEANPREVEIVLEGASSIRLGEVWRFDSARNNPADRREEFLPTLEWAEDEAKEYAYDETVAFLAEEGITDVPDYDDIEDFPENAEELGELLGLSEYLAIEAWGVLDNALEEGRLLHADDLNALPAATVQSESAEEAGIAFEDGVLRFSMEPNSVYVLKFRVR